ncbi:hypothetical protein ACQQ2Q_21370 [Agrobacterium sp. ES01]|uniref:hypothetical protein n=1 Tax=Agrobacterium sp. ES01 TaxID=3420714 RepID=UPI003D1306C4
MASMVSHNSASSFEKREGLACNLQMPSLAGLQRHIFQRHLLIASGRPYPLIHLGYLLTPLTETHAVMNERKMSKVDYRRREFPDHVHLPFDAPEKKEKAVFSTFGAHRPRYRTSALRLADEAARSGWFDMVYLQTDINLKTDHSIPDGVELMPTEWSDEDSRFISENPRGFGYWLWKPLLIKQLLSNLDDGTLLVYADGGCELSQQGGRRMLDYFEMASTSGGLFFSLPFIEVCYSKRELLHRLQATAEEAATAQIQGTILVLRNGADVRGFVDRWIELCREDKYSLLTDALDPTKQSPDFRSHRHDQSILSMLVKRSDFAIIPAEDDYYKPLYRILNSWIYLFPIHARRAQRIRLLWLISGLSSYDRCLAAARGSLLFRMQKAVIEFLSLRPLKSRRSAN